MSIFVRRQIKATAARGILNSISDGTVFNYRVTDSLPKYVLKLDPGKVAYGFFSLEAGESYVIPLPETYESTERLCCLIKTTTIGKIVTVSPTHGTSTVLVKGTDSTAEGEHPGIYVFQADTTSITASVPAGSSDCDFEYFFYEVPDLSSENSYRLGLQALGVA